MPRPLEFWLMKRQQGLRQYLSLLEELQGGTPSVISVGHYHDMWNAAIDELTDSNFCAWGANLFELLSREAPQEDVDEAIRACKRLKVHLLGLVKVTGDLAMLARQLDPRARTGIYEKVDLLNKKARTLATALGEMLTMRAKSAKTLLDAERSQSLVHQGAIFCKLFLT